jgi:hypothetical protein
LLKEKTKATIRTTILKSTIGQHGERPTTTRLIWPNSTNLSVADQGCFIPDPDPTYFCIKAINKFSLLIPDPDPGGKKAPDLGSVTLNLTTGYRYRYMI